MTDERDLLRAVFATPDDDLPRLVLADWWDEHGQPERAEFVRLAIALDDQTDTGWSARRIGDVMDRLAHLHRASLGLWGMRGAGRMTWASYISPTLFDDHIVHPHNPAQLFRRGWVESVRLPLAAFLGETCEFCSGRGHFQTSGSYAECPRCKGPNGKGTGRVGGCAAELFRSQPVVRVEVAGTGPYHNASDCWLWLSTSNPQQVARYGPAVIPPELFERLTRDIDPNNRSSWRTYRTRAAALDALSAALVQWGRELAGLTALPSPE